LIYRRDDFGFSLESTLIDDQTGEFSGDVHGVSSTRTPTPPLRLPGHRAGQTHCRDRERIAELVMLFPGRDQRIADFNCSHASWRPRLRPFENCARIWPPSESPTRTVEPREIRMSHRRYGRRRRILAYSLETDVKKVSVMVMSEGAVFETRDRQLRRKICRAGEQFAARIEGDATSTAGEGRGSAVRIENADE